MIHRKSILLASVLLGGVAMAAAAKKILFTTNAESSFSYLQNDDGSNIYRSVDHHYFVQELYKEDEKIRLLFSTQETSDIYEDLDHVEKSLQLTAQVDDGDRPFGKTAWTLSEPATTAGLSWNDSDLLLVRYDDEASNSSYRAYDILTGKLLTAYESFVNQDAPFPSPYVIYVPNSTITNRYVGIVSRLAAHDFDEPATPPPAGYQNAFLIKYSSKAGVKSQWMVQIQLDENYHPWVSEVKTVPFNNGANSEIEIYENLINLWDLNGKTNPNLISGFAFEILVFGGENDGKIVIPVKNDQLDLAGAVIPPNMKVVVLP